MFNPTVTSPENAVAAGTNTTFKFVRASDGGWPCKCQYRGYTDGATFATTLAQQFTARPLLSVWLFSQDCPQPAMATITITADQSFTVAAANTKMLVGINDDTAQASALSGGFAVSATITNATVTLTGQRTLPSRTALPRHARHRVNYIVDGNFDETTTVSNNAAIAVPAA